MTLEVQTTGNYPLNKNKFTDGNPITAKIEAEKTSSTALYDSSDEDDEIMVASPYDNSPRSATTPNCHSNYSNSSCNSSSPFGSNKRLVAIPSTCFDKTFATSFRIFLIAWGKKEGYMRSLNRQLFPDLIKESDRI